MEECYCSQSCQWSRDLRQLLPRRLGQWLFKNWYLQLQKSRQLPLKTNCISMYVLKAMFILPSKSCLIFVVVQAPQDVIAVEVPG